MATRKGAPSMADKVRVFLVEHPDWTHQKIADKLGTKVAYVDKVSSQLRRRGNPMPDRRAARASAEPDPDDGSGAATGGTAAGQPAGLRLVTIERLTPPPVRKEPEAEPAWACDQCGHQGSGKPPAACPKCGGA